MNVFISHSHKDKPAVRKIAERLRQEGVVPWLDEELIMPGQSWADGIHKAISNSDALLVIISHATTESRWQRSEIALSLAEQRTTPSKRVIPVLVERGAELPFFLKDRLYCDLSDDEKFERNFSKLLAALTASPEEGAVPEDADRAKLREISVQKDILEGEAKDFERKRLLWASTVLAAVASIIGASSAVLALVLPKFEVNLGFLKSLAPFGLGALFGVLSSIIATAAVHYFQRRSTRGGGTNGAQ